MPQFEDFQLESIDGRKFITQRESSKGLIDAGSVPIRRKDMNTDGNGFDPTQRFTEHLPDGFDANVGVALVGDEGVFGGNFMPRYSEVALDLPQICGTSGLISTSTLADSRTKKVWKFPNGIRDIETLTAWFGQGNKCWLLQYGKIMTWVIESDRTGETGGNKSYHFNSALRNQSEPNAVAQNHRVQLKAFNVTGNLLLSVQAPGGAVQALTINKTDSNSAIKTKFEALDDIATVVVSGAAFAAGSAINEVQTIKTVLGTYIGGAIDIVGSAGTQSIVPGESLTSIGNKLSAAQGVANGSIVATGTNTGGVALANIATFDKVIDSHGTGSSGIATYFDGVTTDEWELAGNADEGWIDMDLGAPTPLFGWALTPGTATGNQWNVYTKTSPFSGSGSGGGSLAGTLNAATANTRQTANFAAVPTARYVRFQSPGNVVGPRARQIELFPAGPGVLDLVATYSGGAVAGANQTQLTSPTPGITTGTTTQGAAATVSGSPTIEFTSPANTFISVAKTSGESGYSVEAVQAGSDGTGPSELPGSYIEPTHWLVLKAATKADLDAIDMGDATHPISDELENIVKTATAHTVSLENLAQVVYLEDGKVNPGSHITRRPAVTASLTLAVQQEGDVDYAEDIYATENFGGCGVEPFWLRFRARCDQRELWIDLYCARNQQAEHPAQEGLAQWQFPLTRMHNAAGSLFFTTIEPS